MRRHRVVFTVIILLCAVILGYGAATSSIDAAMNTYERQADLPADERTSVVPASGAVTVVTGQGMKSGPTALVAFGPNGEVIYYNDSFGGYFDVDPSSAGQMTVEYVADRPYEGPDCNGKCTLSVVERVNLTTGEVTRIYSRIIPHATGANWHDVDRLGPSRLLVGSINRDAVFVVNTTTGLITWRWSVQNDYPLSSGGSFPADWSHLNDVERLPDGRYMVSLRNHDQVVFIDPQTGLQPNWTLGADDDYDTLYEQHNPDYIPRSRGGPAVVVADSLNDRIVEYQRVNGSWKQTWVWTDDRLQWPRDADRLSNGNTLIADTNGHRVIEINRRGEVVWSIDFYSPYEAERLGTGDESAGGPSAMKAGLDSHRTGEIQPVVIAGTTLKKLVTSIVYMLPPWMGFGHIAVAAVMVMAALVWAIVEVRLSPITLQWPLRRE